VLWVGTTALLGVMALTAFQSSPRTLQLDELTVGHIKVVDSTGRVCVELAGSAPRQWKRNGSPVRESISDPDIIGTILGSG
jgi:hypothetical protein